jgi:hypothetical protein
VFGERDPVAAGNEASFYAFVANDVANTRDTLGLSPSRFSPYGYNWLTGIQAHNIFSEWVKTTTWFVERLGEGKVFVNKSIASIIDTPDLSDILIRDPLKRPDLAFKSKGWPGAMGEFFELKPVTHRIWKGIDPRDEAQMARYQRALGPSFRRGDATSIVTEAPFGGALPLPVMDFTGTLYRIRITTSPMNPLARGLIYYRLERTQEGYETIPGWVRDKAKAYDRRVKAFIQAHPRIPVAVIYVAVGTAMFAEFAPELALAAAL